jgi:membrane dipeptidase
MSITWNDDNLLGCGASTTDDKGLTLFGKECIKSMNEKKIIIDISHASKKTVSDVLEISTRPVIATHSCVHNICNHTRNLTDEEIKKIADNKGVIGICFYKYFLTYADNASSDDIVAHIDYIVNLVGIDYVGLGSDFDGIRENESPIDIKSTKDFNNIFSKLKDLGYTKADIEKIAGGNFRRILSESL